MPDPGELPRGRRAVVPLVGAGDGRVAEVVADRLPGLAAVVGTLHELPVPAGRLRRIDAVRIGGRPFQVVHLPAAPERPVDLPVLALAVGRQDERTLARPHEHPHATHQPAPLVGLNVRRPGDGKLIARSGRIQKADIGSVHPDGRAPMPLYMDVHHMDGPVNAGDVAKAHEADLAIQGNHGVDYKSYWVDE